MIRLLITNIICLIVVTFDQYQPGYYLQDTATLSSSKHSANTLPRLPSHEMFLASGAHERQNGDLFQTAMEFAGDWQGRGAGTLRIIQHPRHPHPPPSAVKRTASPNCTRNAQTHRSNYHRKRKLPSYSLQQIPVTHS